MASDIPLRIVQGQDGDGVLFPAHDGQNQPLDITGWRARGQVRRTIDSTQVVHEWDSQLNPEHCNTSEAGVTITWTAAETSAWCGETFVYGIELTDLAGLTYRFVYGVITLDREIVR